MSYKYGINTQRCNSCRRSKRCWSLCTCLWRFTFWRKHDSICAFRIPSSLSLQGFVKLETGLARRTARRAQVKQLKSEKFSPCRSRGNIEDSNACASTTLSWPLSTSKVLFLETPKIGTVLILLPDINDFLQNRQLGSRSISLCFETELGVTHAWNWLTGNDLTDRCSAR